MARRFVVEADGGSRGNPGPAGYGAVVRDADSGEVLAERADFLGRVTNNVAEYRGLIAGLEAVAALDPTASVEVCMDSKLVVEQMSGRWQVKHSDMKPLVREASALRSQLGPVTFRWIPRERNKHADRLANEAMDAGAAGRQWAPRARVPEVAVSAPSPGTGWSAPKGTPTTLLLLRHGQTPMSVDKRFSGIGDPELTALGHEQAAAAARRLASRGGIDAIVTSPLRRARQTADAVATAVGLHPELAEGMRETDFGDWEGYTFGEIRQKWPDELTAWLADPSVAPPYGESFEATALRVRRARDEMLAQYPGQTVVVVSHVSPIKTLLRLALEAPPVALHRIHLDLACLSEITAYADGPAIVRSMNDTGHLGAA